MFEVDHYRERDREFWSELWALDVPREDLLLHFQAFVRRRELPRFLAHYELFKQVIDLPGCVLDLGVFKGASLFTWTKLMETFCPGDRSRRVYGFDSFEGLTDFTGEDGAESERSAKVKGGYTSDQHVIERLVWLHNQDGIVPGIDRVALVPGNIQETLPTFLEEHPGLRISLLHLDMDLYEPTRFALERLLPLVVKGGVVAFDEYGLIPWEGESVAAEEVLTDLLGGMPTLRKFPFSQQPHGYFVK